MPPKTKVEYVVECGTGIAPYPRFTSKKAALKRWREEKSIDSYVRPGTKRRAGVVKITTTVERIR